MDEPAFAHDGARQFASAQLIGGWKNKRKQKTPRATPKAVPRLPPGRT
jgi:hypothetical protein